MIRESISLARPSVHLSHQTVRRFLLRFPCSVPVLHLVGPAVFAVALADFN